MPFCCGTEMSDLSLKGAAEEHAFPKPHKCAKFSVGRDLSSMWPSLLIASSEANESQSGRDLKDTPTVNGDRGSVSPRLFICQENKNSRKSKSRQNVPPWDQPHPQVRSQRASSQSSGTRSIQPAQPGPWESSNSDGKAPWVFQKLSLAFPTQDFGKMIV